jgi:hypothetical protein
LTLDGYGAVFNSPTTIDSFEGRFKEQIAPGAMKRSFRETPPKVQFDHGRHPLIGSIPIAELRSISEDRPRAGAQWRRARRGRLFDNWLMAAGPRRHRRPVQSTGMSFRFSVVRDSWTDPPARPSPTRTHCRTFSIAPWYDDPDDELPVRTLRS